MHFHYFALALYSNANATQVILPILHFAFSSYFRKFGGIFKDYEIIFPKYYDYYESKKRDWSGPNAKTFAKCYIDFTVGLSFFPAAA